VTFTLQLTGDTEPVVGTLPILFTVADTVVMPVWDSVTSQCGIRLAAANNANMGAHGIGGANLGFPQPSPECDTNGGTLNPGNADIYLADASPVIIKKNGSSYAASWAVFDDDITSPNGFKPLYPSSTRGSFSVPGQWDGYNTGTFCTSDSLVKLERTIWAPLKSADSCKFVIMRTKVFPFTPGMSVSNLAIGDVFDFDVPSDSGEYYNIGGTDPTRRLVWVRGFRSDDTSISNHSCYNNGLRYAGAAMIQALLKNCITADSAMFAGYNAANDSFVYPASGFVPEQLWANMQAAGYSNEARITDLHSMLVYRNGANNTGFTLPANDTLTVWTALAVVRPTGGTIAQGLDSLKKEIDKAFRQWNNNFRNWCWYIPCCVGYPGNVNKSSSEAPDLSDLALLISYFVADPRPALPCSLEADINSDFHIDLSDLSLLIAYLTMEPRPTLPICRLYRASTEQ
jgi:hypothetical protein